MEDQAAQPQARPARPKNRKTGGTARPASEAGREPVKAEPVAPTIRQPVDTPEGPGVLIPYSPAVHEHLSPGWWAIVEHPDGHRRIWRLDQLEVKP